MTRWGKSTGKKEKEKNDRNAQIQNEDVSVKFFFAIELPRLLKTAIRVAQKNPSCNTDEAARARPHLDATSGMIIMNVGCGTRPNGTLIVRWAGGRHWHPGQKKKD